MGVFLHGMGLRLRTIGLPHTRGGVSTTSPPPQSILLSSPHTWGCFQCPAFLALPRDVFPTHVGVFLKSIFMILSRMRLPHTRGGVSYNMLSSSFVFTSSPHTWGCFRLFFISFILRYVFPTRVGVFLVSASVSSMVISLPHTRGGVSDRRAVCWTRNRSSPHAWGCFSCMVRILQSHHVFPTRVGVFLPPGVRARAITCLPPHAWGCFPAAGRRADGCRVFPTCVGVFLHHV